MISAFEQALASAVDDINAGRLQEPDYYLELVPDERREELRARLEAIIALRGPITGVDQPASEVRAAALAAVAEVQGSAGPTGILPGALKQMRKARGIDRDVVVDHLSAEFSIGDEARGAMEQYYHRLESGQLLGSRIAHRLLRSLAEPFEANPEDLIAAARPIGDTPPPALAPAMGRGSGEGDSRGTVSDTRSVVGPDPDVELVERLFTGGPDA